MARKPTKPEPAADTLPPQTPPETERQPETEGQPETRTPPTDGTVFIRTRHAERFFRCGLEFGRQARAVRREDVASDADWQRLLAEPNLTVTTGETP